MRLYTSLLIMVPTVLAIVSALPYSWWQEYEVVNGYSFTAKASIWRTEIKTDSGDTYKELIHGDGVNNACTTHENGESSGCCPYFEAIEGMVMTAIGFCTVISILVFIVAPVTTRALSASALAIGCVLMTASCTLWYDKIDRNGCGDFPDHTENDTGDYRLGFWMAFASAVMYFVSLVVFIVYRKSLVPSTSFQANPVSTNMGSLLF